MVTSRPCSVKKPLALATQAYDSRPVAPRPVRYVTFWGEPAFVPAAPAGVAFLSSLLQADRPRAAPARPSMPSAPRRVYVGRSLLVNVGSSRRGLARAGQETGRCISIYVVFGTGRPYLSP